MRGRSTLRRFEPDPLVRVFSGGDEILVAPERANTHDAVWSDASVTRVFDPYAPLRIELVDVDVAFFGGGEEGAFELSYPRFRYALLRDGTITARVGDNSVILTLTQSR